MNFRNTDRPNRRELIRGAAMLGAGAAVMAPFPALAASNGHSEDAPSSLGFFA